ncbi:MAG TPA: LCP family protein [Acidimicrobiia bacterium]|jgi:LCP family protein required for cell wall assembly|nr:LCP family protein [Acidimicrobiia bacterium]
MAHTAPSARRGLPRWLKITTITLLVVANLAVLAFIWAIRAGNNLLSVADTNDEVSGALDPTGGDDRTFLIVGSDSRAGLDDLNNFGQISGARADVVMLVKLDSATNSARMLSIPRDLLVDIPGQGSNRINAAYAAGGPSLLVETIQANLGVEVNHYVEIDFVGFQAMVDEVGGIEIAFPYPARDSKSGLDVGAGNQLLDGDQALAYARSRHYQELQDGEWVAVEANDIGRTQRQQQVIRALISRLKSPSSVAEAGEIATSMGQHMTIDSALAEASVASLLWDFKGIITGTIEGETLPTYGDTVDGRSVQIASDPEASNMLANFRAGNSFADQPLRIEVLNGNGVAGAAGDMSRRLEDLGFAVESIGNADSSSYAETTVIVPQGSPDGAVITSALGFGVVQNGTVDNGYDAVVIVGSDA